MEDTERTRKDLFICCQEKSLFWVITMYVNGGMIPTFLLYKQLGLTNSFGVYVIPGMVSAFNMLVIRTYMNGISDSLEESVQQQPLLPCFQLFVFIHFYRNTLLPGLLLAE